MGQASKIEWTDATWNPVTGCTKVSQGCKNCYAERIFKRPYPHREFTDVQCHPERLEQPLKWRKPRKIFVNSMSDLFHEKIPDEFIDQVFAVMAEAQQHTFQILTKRAERMCQYLQGDDLEDRITEIWQERKIDRETWSLMLPLSNVWLGVSVENQEAAGERIPLLLQTPAAVRFLSVEPLLGPVDLAHFLLRRCTMCDGSASIDVLGGGMACPRCFDNGQFIDPDQIGWVIVGGESGPDARPMHPDWARSIRDECVTAGVPFFFKQWGEFTPAKPQPLGSTEWGVLGINGQYFKETTAWNGKIGEFSPEQEVYVYRVGKKHAGRLLDGREWDGMPNA